ncbi:kinase-like domain-containing protein [Sporodiniella umbellata]|nr:kinase-like domain-containing protein [Sporodiniella umbellata]
MIPGTLIENFQIKRVLGKGAYGEVHLAQDKTSGKEYAMKTFLPHHRLIQEQTEIDLHTRLSKHPNIVELKKVIKHQERSHVLMEYGPEGDLFSAITERDLYTGNHPMIRKVFLQLLDAVSYCHENGVYHRDLKTENILVFDAGHQVKLTDFGLATTQPVSQEFGCGSTFYFSPECQGDLLRGLSHMGYATAPNDVWALGVILINLATGRNPWKQASLQDPTFRAYLKNPDFLLQILPISQELNRIVKRIFCINPTKRIHLADLKQKISQCRYFTRTAESDRYERIYRLAKPIQRLAPSPSIAPKQPKPANIEQPHLLTTLQV